VVGGAAGDAAVSAIRLLPAKITLRLPDLRGWRLARLIIFTIGLCFALIPSFYYITDHEFVILPIMAAAIFLTHLALTLRTLYVAASHPWHGEGAGAWEAFALTGVSARRYIEATWQGIVGRTWGDHALFALLRLGLAVGIAQLLHMLNGLPLSRTYLVSPFYYYSHGGNGMTFLLTMPVTLVDVLMGGVVLLIFSIMEAQFLAALILFIGGGQGRAAQIGTALLVRAALFLIALGLYLGVNYFNRDLSFILTCNGHNRPCLADLYQGDTQVRSDLTTDNYALSSHFRELPITFSTLADNGTMVTADLMRPTYGLFTMLSYRFWAIFNGLLLYHLLTRGLLRLAVRRAVRRGMLP
jgi:hypothetical protein